MRSQIRRRKAGEGLRKEACICDVGGWRYRLRYKCRTETLGEDDLFSLGLVEFEVPVAHPDRNSLQISGQKM